MVKQLKPIKPNRHILLVARISLGIEGPFRCTMTKVREKFRNQKKIAFTLTRRIPLRTEIPLTLSTDKSTSDAITMMRSKMFHPLQKYSLLRAINFRHASRVKNEVNTWLPMSATGGRCLTTSSSVSREEVAIKYKGDTVLFFRGFFGDSGD